jgi:hypothetical protein
VEALLAGRRLTLIDVARSWPGAMRVRAPLKAFDRLLSNPHLHRERVRLYGGMAQAAKGTGVVKLGSKGDGGS